MNYTTYTYYYVTNIYYIRLPLYYWFKQLYKTIMIKLDINAVTSTFKVKHIESVTNLLSIIKFVNYGREVKVYLSESEKLSGKYNSIQYIEHIPSVGSFVGTKLDKDYYVSSIYEDNNIMSIVCEPKI